MCQTSPVLTDLDGDGLVEVVVGDVALDGATGAVEVWLDIDTDQGSGNVAVADLDLDGTPEILVNNGVFEGDGTPRFLCGDLSPTTFIHPVNTDADLEGEVLVGAVGTLSLCDDDGTELWRFFVPYTYTSPVTAADFDGDGRPELIYGDEEDLWILDGATGAGLAVDGSRSTNTGTETPAIADVNGDGEILTMSERDPAGVVVFQRHGGEWARARPSYASQTYYGDDIGDDLSIPPYADPPWMGRSRLFRGQTSTLGERLAANLGVEIVDACVASCEPGGVGEIALSVWNDGALAAEADTLVRVYGWPDGMCTLVYEAPLGERLWPGRSVEWVVPVDGPLASVLLEAVVDEDEAVVECDEADNRSSWEGGLCP